MADWTSGFMQSPPGSSHGSVSCVKMNETLLESKERMSLEHDFDETAASPPICPHKEGECTVVGLSDGTPSSNLVADALQYDYVDGGLYRDTGAAMEGIGGKDHGALNGLADDDHTQYLKAAGGTVTDVDMQTYKVTGLKTADVGWSDEYVVSRAVHLGDDPSGGAKHDDDTFSSYSSFKFGGTNFDVEQYEAYDGNPASGDEISPTWSDYSLVPFIYSPGNVQTLKLVPKLYAGVGNFPADYVPNLNFIYNGTSGARVRVWCIRIN